MTRAQVSLETREAVATYDPRATNVDALIAAVNAREGAFSLLRDPQGAAACRRRLRALRAWRTS